MQRVIRRLSEHDAIAAPPKLAAALYGGVEGWLRDLIARGEVEQFELGPHGLRVVFLKDVEAYLRRRCRVEPERDS